MDLTTLQAIVGLVAIAFLYFWFSSLKSDNPRIKEPPEPAGWYPIIGHLLLLGGTMPLFRILVDLADKYGPIFTLRLGVHRTVVVSSWEVAKECFTINDKALAGRPPHAAGKYLNYNYAVFVLSSYGRYWREMRKMATLELLSSSQLELLKDVRCKEIDIHVNELYELWSMNNELPIKVDMKQWFEDLTFNIVLMSIAGRRYHGKATTGDATMARRFRELVDRFFYLNALPIASDVVPWLEWLDLGGHIKEMKRVSEELDAVVSSWVEDHRQRSAKSMVSHQDFIDVMLSTLEKSEIGDYDADTISKATCLALMLAGTDTTSVTLTWALALLIKHPHVLSKARDELEAHVGRERKVEESDIKSLLYLHAIVKETLRLYPAGPLGVPHQAMEDCQIGGYHVPAGSRVFVNLWKIHHDPNIWEEPNEFRPERFLTSHVHVDLKGKHFEFIPFGSGRRICPGIAFALQVLHLTLARLIHEFDMEIVPDKPIDMDEAKGVMMRKKGPLEIMLKARFPRQFSDP